MDAPPTLHITLPYQVDRLVHVWPCHEHGQHTCTTARGAGICACCTYRLCDPTHHACGDDCPCLCHEEERCAA